MQAMRPVLLKFEPGQSLFHRLTPLPKLLWVAAVTIAAISLDRAIVALLLFGLVLATARLLCGIRLGKLSSVVFVFFGLATTLFIIQAFTTPGITFLFALGPLKASIEGVNLAGTVALRMAILILVAAVFVTSTDPAHLGTALHDQLKLPPSFVLAFFMALRMADIFERELAALTRTYRLRFPRQRVSLLTALKSSNLFTVGLLIRGLRRGQAISLSMMVRGLDRSAVIGPPLQRGPIDRIFSIIVVAASVIFVATASSLTDLVDPLRPMR